VLPPDGIAKEEHKLGEDVITLSVQKIS